MNIFQKITGRTGGALSPEMQLALRDKTKANKMLVDLQLRTEMLTKKDIGTWRSAWQQAINVQNPNRNRLYDVYTDVEIDLHVTGCISQRKGMVKKRNFKLVDKAGIENKAVSDLFKAEWFDLFVDHVLDSRYYGHSLIQFGAPVTVGGTMRFDSVELVPRRHVIPEYGVVVRHPNDIHQNGISYRTANDGKVREEHAILHNTTLPPSDPFWDKYLPPNGWNCRCTVVQVRKGKYPTSDPELAMQRGDNCTAKPKQQIFRFNPGKSMKVFPEKHPYLPKGCGNCSLKLAYSKNSDVCQACKAIANIAKEKQERIRQNRAEYERLKADHDYKDVKFDPKTGGLKATHKGHCDLTNDKSRFFDLTPNQLEQACQDQLFHMGHKVILCAENVSNGKGKIDSSLDMILDGKRMDIASITQDVVNYRNKLLFKNRQLQKFNHLEYVKEKADAVCLYFHDQKMFVEQKVFDGMERLRNYKYTDKTTGEEKSVSVAIKHIYCVVKGVDEVKMYDF